MHQQDLSHAITLVQLSGSGCSTGFLVLATSLLHSQLLDHCTGLVQYFCMIV